MLATTNKTKHKKQIVKTVINMLARLPNRFQRQQEDARCLLCYLRALNTTVQVKKIYIVLESDPFYLAERIMIIKKQ